jgi:hypothetical protein
VKGAIYLAPEGTDPNDPEVWNEISCAEVTGYSVGPVSVEPDLDTPVKVSPVYRSMAFVGGRGYGKTQAQEKMAEYLEAYGWGNLEARHYANVLGQWQETPREELQRRLNNWLRGTYPGEPINWKGLS